jgi:hypothetical protein
MPNPRNPYPPVQGNRLAARPDGRPLGPVAVAGVWFDLDRESADVQHGRAVTLAPTGYRVVTLATSLALTLFPVVTGIALSDARAGERVNVALAGTIPNDYTGLPAQAGTVTLRADGSLELNGTGPFIGYTNADGTLLLQLSTAPVVAGPSGPDPYDALPEPVGPTGATGASADYAPGDHVHALAGLDGIDVVVGEVRSSRDLITDTLSAAADDYSPTGWDAADVLSIVSSSTPAITGFVAPTADGTQKKVLLVAPGSSTGLTLSHQSGSSAAANRLSCPGNASLTLAPGDAAIVQYLESVWRVIAVARDYASLIPVNHDDLGGRDLDTNHPLADDSGNGFLRTTSAAAIGTPVVHQADGSHDWDNVLLNMLSSTFLGAGSFINNLGTLDFRSIGNGLIRYVSQIQNSVTAGHITVETSDGNVTIRAQGSSRDVIVDAADVFNVDAGSLDVDTAGGMAFQTVDGSISFNVQGVGRDFVVDVQDDAFIRPDGTLRVIAGANIDGETTDGNIEWNAQGAGRDVILRAGDQIDLIPGSSSYVDFNDRPARNMAYLMFHAQTADPPVPASNEVTVQGPASGAGVLKVRPTRYVRDYPVTHQFANSATNGSTLSFAIDFTDIDGMDFSNRIVKLKIELSSTGSIEGNGYVEQWTEAWFIVNLNTGTTCSAALLLQDVNVDSTEAQEDAYWTTTGSESGGGDIEVNETGEFAATVVGTIVGLNSRIADMVVTISGNFS